MKNSELTYINSHREIPDVIGYTLDEAMLILDKGGIGVHSVKVTAPPREKSGEYDGSYRVLKAKMLDNDMLELLICKPL